jgi:hypothetical protein
MVDARRVAKSFRLPEDTAKKMEEIQQKTGDTETQVLIVAVDRMYRDEFPESRQYTTEHNGEGGSR